jgi:BirA family biotin operon repressor/biotin-[acetyl-CoA-carboxylase] ligase
LELLADGHWHSGVALGAALGLSRAAIWKQVRTLRTLGLVVMAERHRGYRLEQPLELLSAAAIRSGLLPATLQALESLDVLAVTISTNECLTARPAPPAGRIRAVAAEYQTGGRGRRGRRWFSPLGHGVCLSISWCFEIVPRDLPALSLVAGVAVLRALGKMGLDGAQLKWPNDVMAGGGKVGGILVEVAGEPGGPLRVVIGVGLNVRPVPAIEAAVRDEGGDAPVVALDNLGTGSPVKRNILVAALLNDLHGSLRSFSEDGWQGFLAAWRRHDYLADRPVVVTRGTDTLPGIARGIADDGALLVETEGRLVPVVAGDVTLRATA